MLRVIRWCMFFTGLVLLGLGNAMAVKVQFLGLNSWDVLNVALFNRLGLTIGTWGVLCGIFLIFISLIIDRKYINFGTILNAMLVGPIMDFFLWTDILPDATHSWVDFLIIGASIVLAGIGGGMYVASGMGAGPRDGFMLTVSDLTGVSVSNARIIVESIIVIIGFLLGGPVFIFTFIYTFIQSPIFQRSFHYFKGFVERFPIKTASSRAAVGREC
ncbi:YczE/YyaS/YitT family protein [Peribacillus sp. SCS-155]|uniref:YczE/YyaS/YitT family protein n=1 Tax=Peribacillus sedimenti TaxID=3115297 RepID=UPI003905908E